MKKLYIYKQIYSTLNLSTSKSHGNTSLIYKECNWVYKARQDGRKRQ